MKDIPSIYIFFLIFVLSFFPALSFGQEVPFSPRENIIFATLNQLQEREEVIREVIQEMQLRLTEEKSVPRIKEKESERITFKDIASRTHPYLNLELKYDDNINLAPVKKGSLISRATPGLKMNFIGRGRSLNLNAYLDGTYYNSRSRTNSLNAQIDILANFAISRYTLSFSNDYYNNYLGTQKMGVKKDQTQYYWKNDLGLRLGRNFNRIGFDIGYKRSDYDYESDYSAQNDRAEETFNLNQYLRIATKTQLLFEYSHLRAKYAQKPTLSLDYNYDDLNLGVAGVLSSKLTGLFKIGYKSADYKNQNNNYRETNFSSIIGYKISERSDMAFTFKHLVHETSSKSNYYLEDDLKLTGNHRFAFNPKLNLSYTLEGDYFDYKKKIETAKESNIYTWNLGLSYAFKQWLDFSLDYTLKRKSSNLEDSYKEKIIAFKTQARF